MATEQAFVAEPVAIGGGRIIASPFQFYATGEDRLRLVTVNSQTGIVVKLRWRFVDTAGNVQANEEAQTPNTDRTTKTSDFELGVGALLNLTAFASSGSPKQGQTFVIVQLVRGFGAAAIVLGTLLAGYVTSVQHLAWPGSPVTSSTDGEPAVRSIAGTVPAGGVEFSETVPAGARWELLGLTAQLVTSAAAGARVPVLQLMTPFAIVGASPLTSPVNASTTQVITWAQGVPLAVPGGVTRWAAPVPAANRLLAQQVIQSFTVNLDAGDQWTAPAYTVREWLEVS